MTWICSVPLAQPILPISDQPKQNQAESGTANVKVNPTHLSVQMAQPVCNCDLGQFFSKIPVRFESWHNWNAGEGELCERHLRGDGGAVRRLQPAAGQHRGKLGR